MLRVLLRAEDIGNGGCIRMVRCCERVVDQGSFRDGVTNLRHGPKFVPVEGSSVCVLSVDGHLVSPTYGSGLLIFALRVLCNKQVAAIAQEHADGQAWQTDSWPIGALGGHSAASTGEGAMCRPTGVEFLFFHAQ